MAKFESGLSAGGLRGFLLDLLTASSPHPTTSVAKQARLLPARQDTIHTISKKYLYLSKIGGSGDRSYRK